MVLHRLTAGLIRSLVLMLILHVLQGHSYPADTSTQQTTRHPLGSTSSAPSAPDTHAIDATRLRYRTNGSKAPQLSIVPYVRPELAARMAKLRPVILSAAARHNRPELSGMSDTQFAEVIALLIYNEHNGWVEDEVALLRTFTPIYQQLQVRANQSEIGSNFSVWPTNLRPSVALEILRHQVPVPEPTGVITVPTIIVAGSAIVPERYRSQRDLFVAITQEISQDELGIEYLAANLERGLYRAAYEGVPVSWRTLAGWHNQGIVQPEQIRANATASDYVRRTSAYLLTAHQYIHGKPKAPGMSVKTAHARN